MKIAIAGMGYVGLSMATLLAQRFKVFAVDIIPEKITMINNRESPIDDEYIKKFFAEKELNLYATVNAEEAYTDADFIIIATPTNYDQEIDFFDTSAVENALKLILQYNKTASIIIKSTVPVGYTKKIREIFHYSNIFFSPEFLRESKALYDNLYPSRIIVGTDLTDGRLLRAAQEFAGMLQNCALKENIHTLFMQFEEAEAVKLFSNTFLALRVSYFNELDTYAELKNMDTKAVISGVCLDPRIGDYYNNPSFGYGGYCLPKDTKQLLANYNNIPQNMMSAVVESNKTRKEFIINQIIHKLKTQCNNCESVKEKVVGIYRLTMKANSDNFRQSSVLDIIKKLIEYNIKVIIYEPVLKKEESVLTAEIINDINIFKKSADLIVANRYSSLLDDVKAKVYTRDLFGRD